MPQGKRINIARMLKESFTEDEGRSFEIGFQGRVSNHLKQLLLRVMVVSVEEKRSKTLQVRIRKTNKTESLLTRRES